MDRLVRAARLASWALLVAGLAGLAYAGLQGQLDVYLLLVVPVVAGTGPWAALGLLAAIAGLVGLVWTSATGRIGPRAPPGGSPSTRGGPDRRPEAADEPREETAERETKGGGVILLGPIPIAWGSDRSTLTWLVLAALALTLAAIGLTLVLGSSPG